MGGRTLPGFILFYYLSTTDYLVLLKVTVIKIVCPLTGTTHRSMGQNRKPRIDPHTYSQLSVGKNTQRQFEEERMALSAKGKSGAGSTGYPSAKTEPWPTRDRRN